MSNRVMLSVLVLLLLAAGSLPAAVGYEAVEYPERPGDREFIADTAGLIGATDEADLRAQLDDLLTAKAIPIIVVTIRSLSLYDAGGMSIETYARMLFDHWGIGHEKIVVRGAGVGREQTVPWNKGILLLVSVNDRKARIELGADWGHTKDRQCEQIMQEHIVPAFKRGDYAGGIRAGVDALDAMARGERIPVPPRPLEHYVLIAVFVVLMIWTGVSLYQSGASGWAWFFWGVVFSVLGTLLWIMLTSKGGRRSGFGGGSFGGGFSGGGGATGSW